MKSRVRRNAQHVLLQNHKETRPSRGNLSAEGMSNIIVIRPIVTYASETWVLKENIIQKLVVFEMKILRGIFGPMKENQIRRIKNNEELDKLIKQKNIVNYIKAQRLSWFGHIQRMPETRTTK